MEEEPETSVLKMSFSFPSHSSFPLDLKQSITLFCLSQQTRSEQRTKLCYFIHSFIRDLGESNKQGRTQQGFQLNLRFEVTHKTELTRVRGCKQARRRKGSRSGYKGFQLRGRGEFRRIKEGLLGGRFRLRSLRSGSTVGRSVVGISVASEEAGTGSIRSLVGGLRKLKKLDRSDVCAEKVKLSLPIQDESSRASRWRERG